MRIPILELDNTLTEALEKYKEEHEECKNAVVLTLLKNVSKADREHAISECFDSIQTTIRLIELLADKDIDVEEECCKHWWKLRKRGWNFKDELKIDIV